MTFAIYYFPTMQMEPVTKHKSLVNSCLGTDAEMSFFKHNAEHLLLYYMPKLKIDCT